MFYEVVWNLLLISEAWPFRVQETVYRNYFLRHSGFLVASDRKKNNYDTVSQSGSDHRISRILGGTFALLSSSASMAYSITSSSRYVLIVSIRPWVYFSGNWSLCSSRTLTNFLPSCCMYAFTARFTIALPPNWLLIFTYDIIRQTTCQFKNLTGFNNML